MAAPGATTARSAPPGRWMRMVMAVLAVVALAAPLTAAVGTVGAPPARAATPIRGMVDAHAHIAASQAFGGALRCGEPFASGASRATDIIAPAQRPTGHRPP